MIAHDALKHTLSTFNKELITLSDYYVVISQDCDVINESYIKEPFVELLGVMKAVKPDGTMAFGKNPRTIQFNMSVNGSPTLCEASIHSKIRLPRSAFETLRPDSALLIDKKTNYYISKWVAKRYIRPAYPTEFVNRHKKKSKTIHKALEIGGIPIETLYLGLNSYDELSEDQPYGVFVFAVVSMATFDDVDKMTVVHTALNKVAACLSECNGINVLGSECRSKADMTLQDLESLYEWDYDYLTNAEASE
jgi:predicted DNA-binding protein (UPF0251 family)